MFFNAIDDEMRKLYTTDKDKHDILLWIVYNTNYQEKYEDLNKYQCYISVRVLSEYTKVDYAKTQRIFKKLEQDGYISYVFKSKSKHKASIIHCHFIESKIAPSNNKYLVTQNKNAPEPHRELSDDNSTNNSSKDLKSNTEPYREPKKRQYNKSPKVDEHGYKKYKYSDGINEHWRKYSEEELEANLLKVQNKKKAQARA